MLRSNDWRSTVTNNIIAFRRTQDDLKEQVIEDIKENTNELKFYITFPEEEGKVFFYSNFSPGMKELYAMEMVLEHMRNQIFFVEDDS